MSQALMEYAGDLAALARAAQVADQVAQEQTLADYRQGKAWNTLKRQREDVALFEAFLAEAGVAISGMAEHLPFWSEVSAGLVQAFVRWQLAKGYRPGSVNVRLSTIRTYARLTAKAKYMPMERYQEISLVHTLSGKDGRNIDREREVVRKSTKKPEPVPISPTHVELIKQQLRQLAAVGDRLAVRDLFLFCLLSDHGFRCGEIAELTCGHLDQTAGLLRFYREKRDKWQVHRLTPDTLAAAQRYQQEFGRAQASYLFAGAQVGTGLARRSINARVKVLGELAGLEQLSPHDLRHYWATYSKGDVGALQQAGGWSSPAMPLKYRVESAIANEGVLVPGQPGWDQAR